MLRQPACPLDEGVAFCNPSRGQSPILVVAIATMFATTTTALL